MAAARAGDRAAYGRLYDRFAPMVHGLLLARVPRADVDDLVQDVFLQAMRRLASLRNPEAFPGWLAAIARNRARDHWRRGDAHGRAARRRGGAPHPEGDALAVLAVDPRPAGGVPRDAGAAARGGHDGPRDRRADGAHARLGARQPAPRPAAAARGARREGRRRERRRYLWDGSGEPDPEVRELEERLRPLRRVPPPPDWSAAPRPRPRWRLAALAAAAALALALGASVLRRARRRAAAGTCAGSRARAGARRAWCGEDTLGVGQWIETRAARARLSVGPRDDEIGEVQLEPKTRVGLVDPGRSSTGSRSRAA